MPATKTPDQRFSDEALDPAQSRFDREFQSIVDNYDTVDDRATKNRGGSDTPPKKTKASPGEPEDFWDGQTDKIQLKGFFSRFNNNRGALKILGIGGGIMAVAGIGFLSLLPLKLEMLIKTVTSHAAEVPEHAIKNRLEYLTKYYIAQRVLGQAYGQDIDVKQSSIAKGMFDAWRAANYEKQLGISIESDRKRPNQRAFTWTIRSIDTGDVLSSGSANGDDTDLSKVLREINGSSSMRTYIREETAKVTKWNQYYKRHAMRKTLMRKYGVSRWAWLPEKASDALDTPAERARFYKTKLRTILYEDVVGSIRGLTPKYLSCLAEGESACRDLKDSDTSNRELAAQRDSAVCPPGDQACIDRLDRVNQAASAGADQSLGNASNLDTPPTVDGDSEVTSKLLSKQVLSKVAGGLGIVDTIMRVINGIENGAINQVIFDRNSRAYIRYSSDILSINDQMKDGENIDLEQVQAIMDQTGDFGASPVWQLESGILSVAAVADKTFERECPSDNDGEKTVLPKGETVCVERKVISEGNPFEGQSWWEGFAQWAKVWTETVGKAFDTFYSLLGGLAEKLNINDFLALIGEKTGATNLVQKGVNIMMEMIFGLPITSAETGPDAGDNIVGGIRSSYFAFGQTGQDLGVKGDGGALGIGGAVMTKTETAALKQQIAYEKSVEKQGKTFFARLLDTESPDSFISQLAIRTPVSLSELATIPRVVASSISQSLNPSIQAAGPTKNSFGFDFDYSFSDAELVTDPEAYTASSCQQSHDSREASYQKNDRFPIMVYTKSDGCALEKVVVCSGMSWATNGAPDYCDLAGFSNAASSSTPGLDMRVATYNVKTASQTDGPNDGWLDSSVRMPMVANIVKQNGFDVIGFQETSASMFNQLRENLPDYDSFPKTYASGVGESGITPVFWRSKSSNPNDKTFKFIEGGTFKVSWRNCEPRTALCTDSPWALLQSNLTGQEFYIMSTHFINQLTERDGGADKRAVSSDEVVRVIKGFKPGTPVFFTGDLNSSWDLSKDDQGISRSQLPYCILTNDTGLSNIADIVAGETGACPVRDRRYQIDHIYTQSDTPITKIGRVVDTQTRKASDHFPHWADVKSPSTGTDQILNIPNGTFAWPVLKKDFTSLTGCYPNQNGTTGDGHAGIDIDVPNTYPSTPIYSATNGTVVSVDDDIGAGISGVQIEVQPGLYANYQHMRDYRRYVQVGQTVKAGQRIGTGSNVGTSRHHLHFGITTVRGNYGSRKNPTYITKNPLDYLPADRSFVNALGGVCTPTTVAI